MVVIRLRRAGSKKRPFFRVVVTDSRAARDSSFVEVLGHYNPRTTPETLKLDRERVEYWVKRGAQASDTVRTLIDRESGAGSVRRAGRRRAVSRASAVVEAVARGLADKPDSVRVTEREARGQVFIELTMAPGDMGRVIGRQGRTAQAVRTLANVRGASSMARGSASTFGIDSPAGPTSWSGLLKAYGAVADRTCRPRPRKQGTGDRESGDRFP